MVTRSQSFWRSRPFYALLAMVVLGALFILYARSATVDSMSTRSGSMDFDYGESEESVAMVLEDSSFMGPSLSVVEADDGSFESKVIHTASLTLDVKHADAAISSMASIAQAYEGYVQSSETWLQGDQSMAGYVTLRVEADYFDQAIEDIKELATLVQSESISGQDVTEEYIDLEARLANFRAEEQQYLEILSQAYTVEDLLMVSDALSDVRGEIEHIEGRLKYLENQSSLSTISVWVYEEADVTLPTADWQPVVVAKEALNTLIGLGQGLVNFLIEFVIVGLPIAIVVAGVVKAILRFSKRRR